MKWHETSGQTPITCDDNNTTACIPCMSVLDQGATESLTPQPADGERALQATSATSTSGLQTEARSGSSADGPSASQAPRKVSPTFLRLGWLVRSISLVSLTATVSSVLLWVLPIMLDGRPQVAVLLTPASASRNAEIQYSRTLSVDLREPLAVAIGPSGDVYVADSGNGRIKIFDPNGVPKATVGRKAATGDEPGAFAYPVGLAVVGGQLFVSDNVARHISIFDEHGQFLRYFAEDESGQRPFSLPGAVFFHRGLLYVADLAEHRVLALRLDGSLAQAFGTGKGVGDGQMQYPGGVWVDGAGTVYVADSNNSRVQVFNADGTQRASFSEPGMNLPRGISGDDAGRIYVANTLGHTVTAFTPDGQYLFSYGASGTGWTDLGFPSGIAVSGDLLYVADRANNRVQALLLPLAGR